MPGLATLSEQEVDRLRLFKWRYGLSDAWGIKDYHDVSERQADRFAMVTAFYRGYWRARGVGPARLGLGGHHDCEP